jgi:hypothetical protein
MHPALVMTRIATLKFECSWGGRFFEGEYIKGSTLTTSQLIDIKQGYSILIFFVLTSLAGWCNGKFVWFFAFIN